MIQINPVIKQHLVSAGDVRHLLIESVERLVLVLKVNSDTHTAQVTLIHSYPEFATEYDVIAKPDITGLSYTAVIQTDIRGVIYEAELGELVTTVPKKLVNACFLGLKHFSEDKFSFIGPALLGPLEARWDFKAAEGTTMRQLAMGAPASILGQDLCYSSPTY